MPEFCSYELSTKKYATKAIKSVRKQGHLSLGDTFAVALNGLWRL